MITKLCDACKKEFQVWPYQKDEYRFCSAECRKKLPRNRKPMKEKTKEKIGKANQGREYSKVIREKISKIKKEQFKNGLTPWNKGKKVWIGEKRKNLKIPNFSGELHWNWQGGITPESIKARQCLEYEIWRMEVLKKDKFTCRLCNKKGGKLVAHHLNLFSKFVELRYSVENGMTLCRGCHSKLHNKKD